MPSKKELLNELFKKYDLTFDSTNPESKDNDVYKHKHYTIITRGGIQKIERGAGIKCQMNVLPFSNPTNIMMEVIATMGDQTYQTFASASDLTSSNKYFIEMCEKRARSRAVLTLAGLYEHGVFGQDEVDEFNETVKTAQASTGTRATYKGNE